MKYDEQFLLKAAAVFFLFVPACVAQSENEMTELVHNLAARLRSPDAVAQYSMPEFTAEITNKQDVNASADPATSKVLLNKTLVQVFYNAPGELAFVIAHEIGHLQDSKCFDRGQRARLRGAALQRTCETAADQIGMQYLLAAGFSPYDAAGAMGRLLMAYPGQNSVVATIVGRFVSDHPVTTDRINQLAEYARQACENRPEVCVR